MTERQKNKVDGIIKLTISSFEVADVFPESIARDLVISLAKVFNIDITKEKADYIVDEIIKNEPIIYDSGYEALAYIIERIGCITAEYFDSEKNINNLDSYINDKFMIEERKRKCEEIINDYKIKLGEVDISLLINPFSSIFQSVHQYAVENITYMTISLAKVFNKDITEEEAKKIVSVLKDTEKRQDIESIGWAIANYFLPRKIEKIINSYEEKYKKEFKEINTLGFHIDGQHTSPIVRMFGIIVAGISFFEFEFGQSEEYLNEYSEFLVKSNNIAGENIIDLTVALSEVFNRNMTKEEAEKLLFTKDIEEDWQSKHSDKFYKSTKEFEYIIELYIKNSPFYNSELDTIFSFGMLPHNINLYMFIFESVGWAIANYFNGKENNNKNNEEENKNFNKENKINNVVENTAKEKIMSNNDELTLNLLILGQTGVGKSSLINALFGRKVAESRVGPPVPIEKGIKKYPTELDGKKVNLFDTEGIEVDKVPKFKEMIDKALKERRVDKDIKDWFHSVTYCIQAGGYKIQDFDIEIIKQFVDEGYNVIVALTKSDQIGKAKREEFIDKIKKEVKEKTKKDIMVITVSADPEQLDHMTEKPKPSGLEEYKAAILISWREIFINRIPVHIVEKLKKDIENAKYNAPREGKDKELSNKIQEYFSNILNENTQKYVRENIEKYYKITADILASSKNINLSNKELDLNFHSEVEGATKETWEMFTEIWEYEELNFGDRIKLIGAATLMIPLAILENIAKPMEYLMHLWEKEDKIKEFIEEVSDEYIEKIGEEEFESEIRKIIINALNEIDKKIIKLN